MKSINYIVYWAKLFFWLSLIVFVASLGFSIAFDDVTDFSHSYTLLVGQMSLVIIGFTLSLLIPVTLWKIIQTISVSNLVNHSTKLWEKKKYIASAVILLKALADLLLILIKFTIAILTSKNSHYTVDESSLEFKLERCGYTFYGCSFSNSDYSPYSDR